MLHEIVRNSIKSAARILIIGLAFIVGLYPATYFVFERFGILANKDPDLIENLIWLSAFYLHITSGGLALLVGWVQFSKRLRAGSPGAHRNLGKTYVIAVILSSVSAAYIALHATGGFLATMGFLCLSITWFIATTLGYIAIAKGEIEMHQKMMVYSYAACFAAVSLRLFLPLLVQIFKDFIIAYVIVSWACWIPNMMVAYLITRKVD